MFMKKQSLILLILHFIILPVFGQIIIDVDDMPVINKSYFVGIKNNINIDLSLTGEDYVWDYYDLSRTSYRIDDYLSISSTNGVYALIYNPGVANIAYPTPNPLDWLPFFTIEDTYEFYNKRSSGYFRAGYGASIDGFPTPLRFNKPEIIYEFPLTYGQQTSSYSVMGIPIPNLAFYGQKITRKNYCDGWGTLIVPYGTLPVLRVKSEIQITDTIYISEFDIGFAINRPPTYEYRWVTKNMGIEILKIVEDNLFSKTAYFRDTTSTFDINVKDLWTDVIPFFPNPASNYVNIINPFYPQSAQIELINTNGQVVISEIMQAALNRKDLNLPSGIYAVRLSTNNNSLVRFLVVE